MEKHQLPSDSDPQLKTFSKTDKIIRITVIIICVVTFVVCAIINGFASGVGKQIGLYINSTGGVSDFYYVEITPAGWAFSIWGIIYAFQACLLVYFVVNIFRTNKRDRGVYYDPNFISLPFLLIYGSNYLINVAWIFLFDRSILNSKLLAISCLFLWFILAILIVCVIVSYLDLDRHADTMLKLNMKVDIWLVRIMAHNGISLYATWCAVASPLNTSFGLTYVHGMLQKDACTVGLSILAVEIVVYVCLDTFFLDRWTRFTISPHCVLVWALSASLNKNYVSGARNSIFTAVLLGIAIAALIEKIILIIVRQLKNPMYTSAVSDSSLQDDAKTSGSTKDLVI